MNVHERRGLWMGCRNGPDRDPSRRQAGLHLERDSGRAQASAQTTRTVLMILAVVFSSHAWASDQFSYILRTSPGSVVFQVRCPDSPPSFRSFVLDRPRRFVVDVTPKGPVSTQTQRVILLASESPVEKIRILRQRDFLRLVFHLPKTRKIIRSVHQDGSTLAFSFKDHEISELAISTPPSSIASSSAAPTYSTAIPSPPTIMPTTPSVIPASSNVIPASSNVIPTSSNVIPTSSNVIPAKTGIQESPTAVPSPPHQPDTEHPPASTLFIFHRADAPSGSAETPIQSETPSNSPAGSRHSVRVGGFLDIRGAADTHRDDDLEHTQALRKRFHLESKVPLSNNANDLFALISARSDLLWFGTRSDWNDWNLDLHEAYLQWADGPWELRLGKQIVRWGKADQLSPVDVANPEDLREGIIWDLEDRKIPVWMARWKTFREPFGLEALFVPFFEPHDIDIFGTDWAVFRHLKRAVTTDPLVPPMVKAAVNDIEPHRREPARTWKNVQWGGRLTAQTHGWDLAVSAFQGFDPTPHIARFPLRNIRVDGTFSRESIENALSTGVFTREDVEVRYQRSRMIGFDFETTWKDFGLRGEAAYFSNRSFLTDDLTADSRPVFLAVLGVDYAGAHGGYANLQLAYQRIGGDADPILYFEKDNFSVNGEVSKEFLRGDLLARLRYLLMLTDGGSYWNPSLTYLGFRPFSFTVGLNLFAGPADTLLGSFRDNDQATVSVRYDF